MYKKDDIAFDKVELISNAVKSIVTRLDENKENVTNMVMTENSAVN